MVYTILDDAITTTLIRRINHPCMRICLRAPVFTDLTQLVNEFWVLQVPASYEGHFTRTLSVTHQLSCLSAPESFM